MSAGVAALGSTSGARLRRWSGGVVCLAFAVMFGPTIVELLVDWRTSGEYGHGFLLLPIALYIAWTRRLEEARPDVPRGIAGLVASLGLFLFGVLAGEFFVQRLAMLAALLSLTVYYSGWRQLRAWWLPFGLLAATIPLPEILLDSITLPLQLLASRTAVGLLEARHIPAAQAGNIIFLPGQELFVAAACSGLRSLSALLGLTLLIAGTSLGRGWSRTVLLVLAIPAAIGANVIRVFATGFVAYYFGPELTQGTPHHALAAVVFLLPLAFVGLVTVGLRKLER